MAFKRGLDTPTLEASFDAAVEAGLGSPDFLQGAAVLSDMRETRRAEYDRLNDWADGGLERIVSNFEAGLDADPQDAAFLQTLCSIAATAAKQVKD